MAMVKKIDSLALEYSQHEMEVAKMIQKWDMKIAKIKKDAHVALALPLRKMQKAKDKLYVAICDSADMFDKPKTIILHNVRIGYIASKTTVCWDDTEKLVAKLKDKYPDKVDVLIKTEEKPIKTSLLMLSAKELKRLPLKVEIGEDQVFIKTTDKDIERALATKIFNGK